MVLSLITGAAIAMSSQEPKVAQTPEEIRAMGAWGLVRIIGTPLQNGIRVYLQQTGQITAPPIQHPKAGKTFMHSASSGKTSGNEIFHG